MNQKKMGRPTKYSEKLADEICEAISTHKESLRELSEKFPHWPDHSNMFRWLNIYPNFRTKYAQAKSNQVEVSIDYVQQMINEEHHYIDDNGNKRVDVGLLRVKVDTVKWKAGKLLPKKYGIKSIQEADESELHAEILRRQKKLDEKKEE